MKPLRLISTLLFFFVSISLFANSEPVAWITFSNPVQENQIYLVINTSSSAEAYTELMSIDTMACLHIPTGKYGYFRVDDATITENDRNLIVKITYFDEGLGSLNFQYNATASDNDARQSLKKTGSNTWVTATLNITNRNGHN